MQANVQFEILPRRAARGLPRHNFRLPFRHVSPPVPQNTVFDLLARQLIKFEVNQELAALLDIKSNTVRAWRYGRRKAPQWAVDHLIKIAEMKIAALQDAVNRAKNPEQNQVFKP